jgi:hypothetical protein
VIVAVQSHGDFFGNGIDHISLWTNFSFIDRANFQTFTAILSDV